MDPPATPGKAPSIALVLAPSPGRTKLQDARVAEGLEVANLVASTWGPGHADGAWAIMQARSVQR